MPVRRKLRVGAVSYLNTKPLVYGLAALAPQAEVLFDLPSRLADDLSAGKLDVALIPSIEYFQNPDYVVVSDACIACRGPVLSVKLYSRTPIERIRTLALDEGSRTSIALVRILLEQRHHLQPELSSLPIGAGVEEADADAVLVIGDRAIYPPRESFHEVWDLGQTWRDWTDLPFVFAMWTARRGADLGELEQALTAARDAGVEHLPQIAQEQTSDQTSEQTGEAKMSYDDCLSYLRDNLHFYLGPKERLGLRKFYQRAAKLGFAPQNCELVGC